MCFPSAPKVPTSIPSPPSAREAGLVNQQDELRRRMAAGLGRAGTIMSSPLGDPGAGRASKAPVATGAPNSANAGTRIT